MEKIFLTAKRLYTTQQVTDAFSDKVSGDNLNVLIGHLCNEELSSYIVGFTEDDGDICFDLGYSEMIRVKRC